MRRIGPAHLTALAVLLAGVGLPSAGGWGALAAALGAGAAVMALARGASGPTRIAAWFLAVGVPFVLLTLFTLRIAAPNIIIAGQKAAERTAVSTLRTVLWAEDEMVRRRRRAGLFAELSGARPVEPPLPAELLRETFARFEAGAHGPIVQFAGYHFQIYVLTSDGAVTDGGQVPPGALEWVAYAWPVRRGHTGFAAFCINRHEDILETANDQGYSGPARAPAFDACLAADRPADRLVDGTGGDGAAWSRWRGKRTRRSREGA